MDGDPWDHLGQSRGRLSPRPLWGPSRCPRRGGCQSRLSGGLRIQTDPDAAGRERRGPSPGEGWVLQLPSRPPSTCAPLHVLPVTGQTLPSPLSLTPRGPQTPFPAQQASSSSAGGRQAQELPGTPPDLLPSPSDQRTPPSMWSPHLSQLHSEGPDEFWGPRAAKRGATCVTWVPGGAQGNGALTPGLERRQFCPQRGSSPQPPQRTPINPFWSGCRTAQAGLLPPVRPLPNVL